MAGLTTIGFACYWWFSRSKVPVNLHDPIHVSGNRVAIGNRVLPKQSWRWKSEWVEAVDREVRSQHSKWLAGRKLQAKVGASLAALEPNPAGLSFWAGFSGDQQVDMDLASDGPHLAVIGATGSGKSQFLKLLIESLVASYGPSQLALILVDFKGGSALHKYSRLPHSLGILTNQQDHTQAFFQDLELHMAKRQQVFSELGISRIEDLPSGQPMPRMLVCIDELLPVLQVPPALAAIESVAARGRSLGIHLVVTAQSLAGFPRSLLTNLTLRLGIGRLDAIDAAQLGLGKSALADSSPPNVGWQSAQYSGARSKGDLVFPSGGLLP